MDDQRKIRLTKLIEAFVRISNKFNMINNKTLDYGSGDLLFPSEIHFLISIQKQKGKNITELGEYLGITKSAASQTAIKLEKKGFCQKTKKENKKNIYLELTQKGLSAIENFNEYRNQIFSDLIDVVEKSASEKLHVVEELFVHLENHMNSMLKEQ